MGPQPRASPPQGLQRPHRRGAVGLRANSLGILGRCLPAPVDSSLYWLSSILLLRPMWAPCKALQTPPPHTPRKSPGICSKGRGRDSNGTRDLGKTREVGEGWWEKVEDLGIPRLPPGSWASQTPKSGRPLQVTRLGPCHQRALSTTRQTTLSGLGGAVSSVVIKRLLHSPPRKWGRHLIPFHLLQLMQTHRDKCTTMLVKPRLLCDSLKTLNF